jgi:transcriptional regulator with GAF, ATPase, and Fis domain
MSSSQGETGTGKELVATALHDHSRRANGPFVVVDCGSLPENLVESELFGHERGAFTGAANTYEGAFERANGGTVFLDEIGELPLQLQPKLLGALERRAIRRVGGKRMIPVDIRVVAATNRDLAKEMNRGNFREDLYYRLAVVRAHVPPLRERRDDIPLLIEHFLSILPGSAHIQLKRETVEHLCNHDYPGNVRELRNLIERSAVLAESTGMSGVDIFSDLRGLSLPGLPMSPPSAPLPEGVHSGEGNHFYIPIDVTMPFKRAKQWMVEEFERRYLSLLLESCAGNVSQAARQAGLDRMTVHKMLNRRGIGRRR